MSIVIVDYGRGNLFSLGQALRHLGVEFVVSSEAAVIQSAERIFFPGVGAYGDAANGLRERNLIEPLRTAAAVGTPILGICVGCQLLLSKGEEFGDHEGLDLIPGTVSKLPNPVQRDPDAVRIPNVGWRSLNVVNNSGPLASLSDGDMMYFVHSFAPMVTNKNTILATIPVNGENIPVVVGRQNLIGVQFHPEKSGVVGLKFLSRFLKFKTLGNE